MYFYRITVFLLMLAGSFNNVAESVWDKPSQYPPDPVAITVYRSPSCGCCGIWLDHIKQHNFVVTDIKTEDVDSVKQKHGVSPQLASCHTALVGGYVIEGHVPANDIRKLLTEKPDLAGLSVPGMPQGTPGMEMGGRKEPFSVISFDKNGNQQHYTDYSFY
ncbi:MAG: DUF411 domain-containing protein [Methylococcaceae bacterium]|nr:DUF411 domain-containing protein [Methylococcaceae bacterium]